MNHFTNTDGQDNVPGLQLLQFIPVQHVSSIPTDENSVIYDEITVLPGKGWFTGEFTPGKLDFGNEMKNGPHGPYHEIIVSGFHAHPSPAKLDNFRKMQLNRFIVLTKDYDNSMRLIGTRISACDFSFKESSGQLGGATIRGYDITFSAISDQPALYYDNDAEPPVGTGFTIYYPDGETIYSYFTDPAGGTFTIPYSSNMIFKHYLSDDPAIEGGASNKRIFVDFIGYDIDHISIVIQGSGLIGQLTDLSAGKKILTAWNSTTGEATFKSPGPAADNQITVFGFSEL
jgi:hypothetical protein